MDEPIRTVALMPERQDERGRREVDPLDRDVGDRSLGEHVATVERDATGSVDSFSISTIVSPPPSATLSDALHDVAVGHPQPRL